MKRVLSIAVLLFITCSLFGFTFTVQAASQDVLPSARIALLEAVSVYDPDQSLDEKITKGEFAELIAKVAFSLDSDLHSYSADVSISDMKRDDPYYDAVSALYQCGYITLDTTGCYAPNAKIYLSEAYEIVLRTMGYSYVLDDGKVSLMGFASGKHLSQYVTADSGLLSRCSAYNMIYNMLYADISDLQNIKPVNNNAVIYMTARLSLFEVSGVVTDDSWTSMSGQSKRADNEIAIGDETYYNQTGKTDLFGLYINGYYTNDRDLGKTLLSLYVNESKNRVTKVYSRDITDYRGRTYSYLPNKQGREKKITVPSYAVIVYNGMTVGLNDPFSESDFWPEEGMIVFIDNNGDGNADVVKIDSYTAGMVAAVDTKQGKIYLQNTNGIIDLENKRYKIEDADGNKVDISALRSNTSIFYGETLDKKMVKMVVSSYRFESEVISRNLDEEYIKTSDGGKYFVSKYAENYYPSLEIGTKYTFYLNPYEEIAGYSKTVDSGEWKIGAFMGINKEDGLKGTYQIKVYTSEGEFEVLELREKVQFISENDETSSLKGAKLYDEIKTYVGIVRYKLDSDNLVKCIEVPLMYGKVPKDYDRLFYLVDTVTAGRDDVNDYYTKILGSNINYGGKALINGDSTVFKIPRDLSETDEFNTVAIENITGGEGQSFTVFGTNYKSKKAAAVVISNDAVIQEAIINDWYYVVKEVASVWDEKKDEPVYSVLCADMNGVELNYYMKPKVYENEVKCVGRGNSEPIKLAAGDMIYIAREDDYISKAICCFDADQETIDERGNIVEGGIAGTLYTYFHPSLLGSPFGNTPSDRRTVQDQIISKSDAWVFSASMHRLFSGWVYSIEDNYMLVTNQNPQYGYDPEAKVEDGFVSNLIPFDRVIYTEIGRSSVTVRKATPADVKTIQNYGSGCSRILVGQGSYDMRTVNIINYLY